MVPTSVPSPRDIANRLPQSADVDLLSGVGAVEQVASLIGGDLDVQLQHWIESAGEDSVSAWRGRGAKPLDLARRWQFEARQNHGALWALTVESCLTVNAAAIAPWLRAHGWTLDDAIRTARTTVAYELGRIPNNVWSQRTETARRLELAGHYFRALRVDAERRGAEPDAQRFSRELSRCVVLSARYSTPGQLELTEAVEALRSLDAKGEREWKNMLRGTLALYDAFNDSRALYVVSQMSIPEEDPEVRLLLAECLVKLAGATQNHERAAAFIARARDLLEKTSIYVLTLEARLAHRTWQVVAERYAEETRSARTRSSARGLSIPFGFRTPGLPTPVLLRHYGHAIIQAIQSTDDSGHHLSRDVLADLCSALARFSDVDQVELLGRAIALREASASQSSLPLFISALRQAEDRFELASVLDDDKMRLRAITDFFSFPSPTTAQRSTQWLLLGSHLRERGPVPQPWKAPPELRAALENGDSAFCLQRAASLVAKSTNLARSPLGGRGKSLAVRGSEYNHEFSMVLKSSEPDASLHDRAVSTNVLRAISDLKEGHRFDVMLEMCSVQSGDSSEQFAVKWYESGTVLSEAIASSPPAQQAELLGRAAEFLALFHARIELAPGAAAGTRRRMRRAELGMWLNRALGTEAGGQAFDAWWNLVEDAPLLVRRDAHPDNWIVSLDGRILAFDFEARTARPALYKLAQLTEDGARLHPTDALVRVSVLDRYCKYAESLGLSFGAASSRVRWYWAGVLARSVRTITDPESTNEQVDGAFETMSVAVSTIGARDTDGVVQPLRDWWERKNGRKTGSGRSISDGQRVRWSRAMSHALRHRSDASLGRAGWMNIDELIELLNSQKHRIDKEALLAVAEARGEHRFEVEGDDIRATHGHSGRINVKLQKSTQPSPELFHATTTDALEPIFERAQGLKRRTRESVHLSSDPDFSRRAAERFAKPVVMLAVNAHRSYIAPSSGSVWVAESVPAPDLSVVPLYRDWRPSG